MLGVASDAWEVFSVTTGAQSTFRSKINNYLFLRKHRYFLIKYKIYCIWVFQIRKVVTAFYALVSSKDEYTAATCAAYAIATAFAIETSYHTDASRCNYNGYTIKLNRTILINCSYSNRQLSCVAVLALPLQCGGWYLVTEALTFAIITNSNVFG